MDLIDRQAAIDAFANVAFMHIEAYKLGVHESMDGNWFNADEAVEALKQLPSVQLSTNLAEVGTDCISRAQAIDALRDYLIDKRCPDDGTLTCRLIENEVINKLPSAEPRCGKWMTSYLDHEVMGVRPKILYCSECNQCIAYPTNFCPNCGADMREVTE